MIAALTNHVNLLLAINMYIYVYVCVCVHNHPQLSIIILSSPITTK